jgi:septal ring factor EnvC (AmiA/AmiB activator)
MRGRRTGYLGNARVAAACVGCVILLTISPLAFSQDSAETSEPLESRIAAMNEQIEAQEQSLRDTEARAQDFEAKLKILKSEAEKLQAEEKSLTAELRNISSERGKAETEVQALELEGKRLRDVSTQRLQVLYTHPREELFAFLVNQAGSDQMAQNGYYLSVVRSYDLRLLERLHELRHSRDEKRKELSVLESSKEKVAAALKSRRAQSQAKIAAQEPLAKSLKAERAAGQEALSGLRAKLLRFETVLAGITGGTEDSTQDEDSRREKRREQRRSTKEEAKIAGYDGTGLKGKRAMLTPPITNAKVLVPFGKPNLGIEKDVAVNTKGIEFSVPPSNQVVAIADGEAIFVGKIPGVGQVAILDHGERYYSLYGRLSSVDIERGQEVKQGSPIGRSGNPDTAGRGFYFEIRREGVAVNPQDFFVKKL